MRIQKSVSDSFTFAQFNRFFIGWEESIDPSIDSFAIEKETVDNQTAISRPAVETR